MNRCVCNGLGAYVDQVDSFPGYLVHECDDHLLPRNELEETVAAYQADMFSIRTQAPRVGDHRNPCAFEPGADFWPPGSHRS